MTWNLDFAVDEMKAWSRKCIHGSRLFYMMGVPLCRVPGDLKPIDTDLLACRIGSDEDPAWMVSTLPPLYIGEENGSTLDASYSCMG